MAFFFNFFYWSFERLIINVYVLCLGLPAKGLWSKDWGDVVELQSGYR